MPSLFKITHINRFDPVRLGTSLETKNANINSLNKQSSYTEKHNRASSSEWKQAASLNFTNLFYSILAEYFQV